MERGYRTSRLSLARLKGSLFNASQAAADRLVAPLHDSSSDLLVVGFWRSGTTWVQQMVASIVHGKTVFEPIHPSVRRARRLYEELGISSRGLEYQRLYMPFASETLDRPLMDFFRDALTARPREAWIRRARGGWSESLRRRVVLKLVRGHLCALAVCRAFGLPVIHVRRDPRAIVASLDRNADWSFWHHNDFCDLLLAPENGPRPIGGRLSSSRRADWALTERYLVDSFEKAGAAFIQCSTKISWREESTRWSTCARESSARAAAAGVLQG